MYGACEAKKEKTLCTLPVIYRACEAKKEKTLCALLVMYRALLAKKKKKVLYITTVSSVVHFLYKATIF
jgi:hypothetical protein